MARYSVVFRLSTGRWAVGLAVLAALALLASACAGSGYGSAAPTQAPPAVQGTTPQAPAAYGAPTAPASPASSAPAASAGSNTAQTVQATLTEFTITLSSSTLKAGHVQFTAMNTGKFPHALEIAGQGIDQKTQTISPGQSATLDVDLTAGKYEVWCPVDSHKERGMDTSITVQ